MTDNFVNYKNYINLMGGLPETNEKGNLDKYYVIELMRRGKDNKDLPAANVHFKNYYIYSWDDYRKYEQEIKELCTMFRMRAYASVNYKLMSQVALDTMAESARRLAAHDYKKFYTIFESCSSKFKDIGNSVWIIDIDEDDFASNYHIVDDVLRLINDCQSKYEDKLIMKMPTKSGEHLIVHTFNKIEFEEKFREEFDCEPPAIKENHLTLLFENL